MWYVTNVIDFCAPPARDIDYGLCAKNFALHTLSGLYSVLVGQLRPFRGKRLKCRHFFIYLFCLYGRKEWSMAKLMCIGRVTADLELRESARKEPYV